MDQQTAANAALCDKGVLKDLSGSQQATTEAQEGSSVDDVETAVLFPPAKRQRVEDQGIGHVRRPYTTIRASRKPQNPSRITERSLETAPVKLPLYPISGDEQPLSAIQRLVRQAVIAQERKSTGEAHPSAKPQVSRCNSGDGAQSQGLPVAVRPGKRQPPRTPPLLACMKREAAASQTRVDDDAAILAASEGLLCMKTTAPVPPLPPRENRTKSLNALHGAEELKDQLEAYCPAPGFGATRKKKPSAGSSKDAQQNVRLPSWGSKGKRVSVAKVLQIQPSEQDLIVLREKDAKLRRLELMVQEKNRALAELKENATAERTQLDTRIADLEADLANRRRCDKDQLAELKKYKAEVASQKDTMRTLHADLLRLQAEALEVHRQKDKKEVLLDAAQQELARARVDIKAGEAYRQELLKTQKEVGRYQKEAEKQAAAVRALQLTNQEYAQKIDSLLIKMAEMAQQVQEASSLRERTLTMQNILNAITSKAEQLRASGTLADLDTLNTLRKMVAESTTLREEPASSIGDDKGKEAAGSKKQGGQERLKLLEQENDLLVARCKQLSDRVRQLEQQISELSKASATARPWKARVAGGQAGEYHTFAMSTTAQVELPEGTLLSVPRSANMQSTCGSLLSLFHEGDILNFLNIDLNSLSRADREAAGRLLLEMNMAQLTHTELSMLMRKLERANLSHTKYSDVQVLARKLLNVLGIHGSMALVEDMVNNGTCDTAPRPPAAAPPLQESDDTVSYMSTTGHNFPRSSIHTRTPTQTPTLPLSKRGPHPSPLSLSEADPNHAAKLAAYHQAGFLVPGMISDVEVTKVVQGSLSSAPGQRQLSPFSARNIDIPLSAMTGLPAAFGQQPASSSLTPSSGPPKQSVRSLRSLMPGINVLNGNHLVTTNASPSKATATPADVQGVNASPARSNDRLTMKQELVRRSPQVLVNSIGTPRSAAAGLGPAGQSMPAPVDGGTSGSVRVVSIPIDKLAQLRNVPAAVLQGLTQHLTGQGGGSLQRRGEE